MSVDKFTSDPAYAKKLTNREGAGVSQSAAPQHIDGTGNPVPYYEVSVKEKPGHASDTTITHTGPGAGVSTGVGKSTDMQGFVSTTGNRVMIDNTFGSDNIILQHHSGATIIIDADGSIHMISSGKKGVGLVSPKGDATVFAKNHLILKADGKLTIETDGDLDMNIGGAFSLHVKGDMHTYVEGSIEEFTDGAKVTEVVKDLSHTVGGDNRHTVAGNMRTQVAGSNSIDVKKDMSMRSDANTVILTQKNMTLQSKLNFSQDVKGSYVVKTEGNFVQSTKGTFGVVATGNTSIQTGGTYLTRAGGDLSIETRAKMSTKANGAVKISGKTTMAIHSTGPADFRSSLTDIDAGAATPETPGTPGSAAPVTEAGKAQYIPAENIIDNMTTIREAPDFPRNAKKMSKGEFSVYKNEGNTPNQKAEAAAASNQGAGAPPSISSGGIISPVMPSSYDKSPGSLSSGRAEQNPLPIPASIYNTNEKISKHVTVGQVLGLRSVAAGQQKAVMVEAMNVAWNIIDPIIEKYGARVQITSWFRSNSGNHSKGGAVDLRCSNKNDVQMTSEIAAYVRDNLPFSKILLERNDSPGIHVHVESAKAGSAGGGTVLTCRDPGCKSSEPGIQLQVAVAALGSKRVV
jgi:hypothetical protein